MRGHKRSMKISRAAYNDLSRDLATLVHSIREKDALEWSDLTYWAGKGKDWINRLYEDEDLTDAQIVTAIRAAVADVLAGFGDEEDGE